MCHLLLGMVTLTSDNATIVIKSSQFTSQCCRCVIADGTFVRFICVGGRNCSSFPVGNKQSYSHLCVFC